jgi:hypothetical protein
MAPWFGIPPPPPAAPAPGVPTPAFPLPSGRKVWLLKTYHFDYRTASGQGTNTNTIGKKSINHSLQK